MANFSVSQDFDANNNILQNTNYGITNTKSQTLSGSNTTVSTALFRISGIVEIRALYGIVTTDLGANATAAYYRLNDQSAQVDITVSTGSTISAFKAGSGFFKRGLVATALTVINNSAGRANESTATGLPMFSPVILTKKTAANTDIEFTYTTTDTPTSGVIQHFVRWVPLSTDGNVVTQ